MNRKSVLGKKESCSGTNYLAGIRVLLQLVIILHHYMAVVDSTNRFVSILASEGYIAVECFFCISGFLFAVVYYPRILAHEYTFLTFAGNRYRRLLPEYLPPFAAIAVLKYYLRWKGQSISISLGALVGNISLLGCGLYNTGDFTLVILDAAWYLTPLLLCNFIAYLFCRIAERLSPNDSKQADTAKRYVLYFSCGMILLGVTIFVNKWSFPLINSSVARGLMGFFIGVIFGLYRETIQKLSKETRYRLPAWLGMLAFAWAVFKMDASILLITDFIMLPSAALLISAYPRIRTALSCKAFRTAEKYTYSLYLWHWVVLLAFRAVKGYALPTLSFGSFFVFLLFLLTSVVAAIISRQLVLWCGHALKGDADAFWEKSHTWKKSHGLLLYVAFCLNVVLIVAGLTLSTAQHSCVTGVSGRADIPIPEITAGTVVCQTLPVNDPLSSVSIQFATWARTNSGTVDVQFVGTDSGTVYLHEQLPAAEFADNAYLAFQLPAPVLKENDREVNVIITADSAPGEAVTIWCSKNDVIDNAVLMINGVQQPGDLAIKTVVRSTESVPLAMLGAVIISCMTVLVLTIIGLVIFRKKITYEIFFSAMALCFGLLYLFAITPISPPDEMHHYQSAYRVSNYLLFQQSEIGDSEDFVYDDFVGHYNTSSGYLRVMNDFFEEAKIGTEITIPLPRSTSYPIEYLAPAVGIAVARVLNLNFIQTFLLGRLMNLLFFVLCIYFAIRCIPKFKLTLGLLTLFPMTLHQAASYSYDTFVNGVSFLLVALIFKAIWEKGALPLRDLVWIFVCGVLLAPAKVVYVPLVLLTCFIPAERFRNKKRKWFFCLLLIVMCALMLLLFQLSAISNSMGSHTSLNWEGGVNYSVDFVLKHPAQTVRIFLQTLKENGKWYFETMIGSTLSGLSLPVPKWIVYGFFLCALLSVFCEERTAMPVLLRIFCLALTAGITVLAMASMFFGWTSNTRQIIQGVQGRYLIPTEPLLFLALSWHIPGLKHKYARLLIIPSVVLEYATLLTVVNITLMI